MTDDPAVRSVRIAVALGERLGELLKGPEKVTAVKQNNALFGVSGNQDDLSLRIGEVQQIYPEIWRHLDDARTAFAARGTDVAAYDEIRAAEGVALGASPDLARNEHRYGQYGSAQTTKSANFNRAGAKRAVQASRALMIATPQYDWEAIAKAESDDPQIAAFTRSTTTRRYVMLGVLAAVIASPFFYVWYTRRAEHERRAAYVATSTPHAPTPGERAKVEKLIADARTRITPAALAWDAAFTPEQLATRTPSTKPCAFTFPAPTARAADKFVKYASVDADYGPGFASFGVKDPIQNQLVRARLQIEGLERSLATITVADAERVVKALPAHVLVIVVDKDVAPKPGVGKAFTPGEIVARAFVYSVADRAITCTGGIDVTNTPGLETPPDDDQAEETLFRDLEVKLRQAIAANLRAVQ